ncbi:hypothetical protein [Curtobacterium aurantiacum]|uniref:hypothetical protein n=1 Tax=Curtobacterium aurantiacum TaxID=3236919 RepID=UPI001BE08565|nr:hypothetical protein [Curtobacterium flaccumfaciens]MBT1675974.1 hypothetical protein [Curtobacterium flaccumfaciens pv. flaccumfaciens]
MNGEMTLRESLRDFPDDVVEVDGFPRRVERENLVRTPGFAAMLHTVWFFFSSVEPAYAFVRSGRMSLQVGGVTLREAMWEARYDAKKDRDVKTLLLGAHLPVPDLDDAALVDRFRDGLDRESSHRQGA